MTTHDYTEWASCDECGSNVSIVAGEKGTNCYKCKKFVKAKCLGTEDVVTRPPHYTKFGRNGAELKDCIWNMRGPEYSAIQYIYRWALKDGYQDLLKAKQYLDWIIEDAKKEHPKDG